LIDQLSGTFRITAATLHDLNEAGIIWIALHIDCHVGAVLERGFAVKELCRLRSPLAGLRNSAWAGSFAVGAVA
jgi:hypothetical protein